MSLVTDPPEVKAVVPPPVVMLPDVCPRTGGIRNFKVEVASFGAYKRGSILPKHVLLRSAGSGAAGREDAIINGMVSSGKFSQTYDPVNVQLAIPKAKASSDSAPDLTRDVNDARAKLKALEQDYVSACADRDGWKAQVKSRDAALGEQAAQIAGLQADLAAKQELIDSAQGEVAVLARKVEELTAQLDEATKPKKAVKS